MATKILVIDDSQMVRQQVGRALGTGGFAVVEAVDGADALEKLQSNADVALIICDVNMPRMTGIEFLEEKKRIGNRVPVIMLTTEGQLDLVHRAKALGAKAWMMKPFKAESLLATVKKLSATTPEESTGDVRPEQSSI